MARSPFLPRFEKLPGTIPIFPLSGALVMPHSDLPLNIFEPRYLNMVEDALSTHRLVGMIQPGASQGAGNDTLSPTGCAGRISQYRETDDGRFEIVLTGVCRFDAGEELPTTRGYRLVKPDWSRFTHDCRDTPEIDTENAFELIDAVQQFLESKDLQIDSTKLEELPKLQLLNSLTCALPLSAIDKQTLLETVDDTERMQLFVALLNANTTSNNSVTRH